MRRNRNLGMDLRTPSRLQRFQRHVLVVDCNEANNESHRSRISPLWKTMSLDEFSTSTSLHGWHFIHYSSDVKHKLAWGLLLGLSISSLPSGCPQTPFCYVVVIGVVSVYGIAVDFLNSKVVITIDSPSASLDEVHFPSLTFCNINQVFKCQLYS